MPILTTTPDPDIYSPRVQIVATQPTDDAPPPPFGGMPQPTPPTPPKVVKPAASASMLTSKSRHVVTGGAALTMLGMGGVAWAADPSSVDPSSPLMLAPVATLAAQAVMALIGYLRDYGAERLEAERARVAEAQEARRLALAEAAALREELRRRDEREDAEREARLAEALEEIKRLRGV